MRKLSHGEVVKRQQDKMREDRLPFVVVLNHIRSLYNVGAIFRTADGVGAAKIWICGITGHPPNHQISKTALGAETQVPWDYALDIRCVLTDLRSKGYQIVLLEQTEESINYIEFEPKGPVALVVGNEIEGVSDNILDLCSQAIEIEMAGLKNSLNVAVAFGVVAYHIRSHMSLTIF